MDFEKNNLNKNNSKGKKRISSTKRIIILLRLLFIIFLLLALFLSYNIFKLKEIKNKNKSKNLKQLKLLTNNNKNVYKYYENCLLYDNDSQNCIYHFLSPKKVKGKKLILLGEKKDGCYVLLNDFKNIKIAYSIGISTRIQFDSDLAKRGIDVYMYDHTICGLPYNNPKFHWKKIGLSGKTQKDLNLSTLDELIKENGHTKEKNMILKIDASGEWDSLKDLPNEILCQFKYIVIEFHFKNNIKYIPIYYNVFKKIYKSHQPIYLRCNNRNNIIILGNLRICRYLEVSYIIRKDNIFKYDDSIYPIFEFDFENPKKKEVIEMNLNILKLF